jgi:peroxiredoxin
VNVPKPLIALFGALALCLVGLNIALERQDARLAALNRLYEANFHLSVGDSVPALYGRDDGGRVISIDYRLGASKTLVLVFARSCPDCELNWPAWHEIVGRVGERVRLVGVSMENDGASREYLLQVGLAKIKDVVFPDPETVVSYRLRYTPQTILVSPDGRVQGVWSGVLTPADTQDVTKAALSPLASPGSGANVAGVSLAAKP